MHRQGKNGSWESGQTTVCYGYIPLFVHLLVFCVFVCITSFIFIHFLFLRFKFNLLAEWVIVCI